MTLAAIPLKVKKPKVPECETLVPRWDSPCIVVAPGETLTKKMAEACRGYPVIAVKQSWKRLPWADVLYVCDAYLWDLYKGIPEFEGEKWSSHDESSSNNKLRCAAQYHLRLVRGEHQPGFSRDPAKIHYGRNSGFQAINMALHWLRGPRRRVVLVGFDMQGGYFYGQHPRKGGNFGAYMSSFDEASKSLPKGIEIINATPKSLLRCFPRMPLEQALTMEAS